MSNDIPLTRPLENQIYTIIFMVFTGTLINLPFGIYFFQKQRKKKVPNKIEHFVRAHILNTPVYNSVLIILTFNLLHIFQSLSTFPGGRGFSSDIFLKMLPVSVLSSLLAGLFAYFWQRYRVQLLYLEHVFSNEELTIRKGMRFSFELRLWISTLMTTLLPIITISLYIIFNITTIENIHFLTAEQLEIIGGEIFPAARAIGEYDDLIQWLRTQTELTTMMYVTAPGTIRMLTSIVLGTGVVFIYIFFFVRWTSKLLTEPIKELLTRMEHTAEGEFSQKAIVRTSDEIGLLTERFNQMQSGLSERERVKQLFGQYLTPEISEAILHGKADLKGDMYTATILFADIRNFTQTSELLTPKELVDFLNRYLNEMIEVIVDHKGIIDKFIGDGVLAVFGAPVASEDHADKAIAAAIAMQDRLKIINQQKQNEPFPPIQIGIGIHTGEVIAGNLGNSKKLEYTVIGETVNLASRIEGLTKAYKANILVSDETRQHLKNRDKNDIAYSSIKNISIRGKVKPVTLYKISSKI